MKALLEKLKSLQDETVNIVSSVSERDYHQQFHPDLSPVGWHLGHCIFTESYWIKEQLLGKQAKDNTLKSLYVPELSVKQFRGSALPEKCELLEWAHIAQAENRSLLKSVTAEACSHHLLEDNYLFYFLILHYSQHIETMQMVLTEIQIKNVNAGFSLSMILSSNRPKKECITVKAGLYNIGSNEHHRYDNERPEQSIRIDSFNIAKSPVSNSDFLEFMNSGAYLTKDYWSDEGWEWCDSNKCVQPHHWYRDDNDTWFGINHNGPYALEENDPVHGLNHYEAEAYANWAGARLPTEHEWEIASREHQLQQASLVWEWCDSTFKPYTDFSAYPYEGYSVPYFDNKHYVLKGGSRYTKEHIKRPSFRNYYTADKRHIFAGVRLVYD